jgi:4-diphosphocytidyl-2-C-methyl-D-erythritol kinase
MQGDVALGLSAVAAAKLTLTLEIAGSRPDGYHLIVAEMISVNLCDTVSLVPAERCSVVVKDPSGRITPLEQRFGLIPRDGRNIAVRALESCGLHGALTIEKRIPFGAGLGGGSSDAAAVLRMAGRANDLVLASTIGADVPFCLHGGRAQVSGVGDVTVSLRHRDETFVLFFVPLVISTAKVYDCFDEVGLGPSPGRNHLLHAAQTISPELASVKASLQRDFGVELDLAGSGSTLFWRGSLGDLRRPSGLRDLGDGRVGYRCETYEVEVLEVSALPPVDSFDLGIAAPTPGMDVRPCDLEL